MATSDEYATLQKFLKAKLFDKGLDNLQTWLPVKDEKVEGVWTDFYNGKPIQDYTPPWFGGKPDGGTAQNCARQASLQICYHYYILVIVIVVVIFYCYCYC